MHIIKCFAEAPSHCLESLALACVRMAPDVATYPPREGGRPSRGESGTSGVSEGIVQSAITLPREPRNHMSRRGAQRRVEARICTKLLDMREPVDVADLRQPHACCPRAHAWYSLQILEEFSTALRSVHPQPATWFSSMCFKANVSSSSTSVPIWSIRRHRCSNTPNHEGR